MSQKRFIRINNRNGNKVTTTVTHDGNRTHVHKQLKKSDGIFGTRILGTEKTLKDVTHIRK